MSEVAEKAENQVPEMARSKREAIEVNVTRYDQPLISVIMNCYNSAKYLCEAIDSVLAQTYTNWEIIFWDNQSTDASPEIFKSHSDPRLRYFYAPVHTPLGQARNLAVEQAKGEWLGFLDCDDLWLPEKLEKQVSIINEEGPKLGLVYGQTRVLIAVEQELSPWARRMAKYRDKPRFSRLPEGNIFAELLSENFVPLVSALVRHAAFSSVGGINPSYKQAEDFDLFVKVTEQFTARAVQEVISAYRVHDTNATQTEHAIGFHEMLEITRRYLPLQSAKQAIGTSCAIELIRRIKGRRFARLPDVAAECGGISYLAFALLRVLLSRLNGTLR